MAAPFLHRACDLVRFCLPYSARSGRTGFGIPRAVLRIAHGMWRRDRAPCQLRARSTTAGAPHGFGRPLSCRSWGYAVRAHGPDSASPPSRQCRRRCRRSPKREVLAQSVSTRPMRTGSLPVSMALTVGTAARRLHGQPGLRQTGHDALAADQASEIGRAMQQHRAVHIRFQRSHCTRSIHGRAELLSATIELRGGSNAES